MPVEIPWGLEDYEPEAPHSKLPYLPLYMPCERFIVIDEEDFAWASQWRWYLKPSKNRKKWYACRSTFYEGRRLSVYLHKSVAMRAFGPPKLPSQVMVDHKDGNEFNLTRRNLRWATPSENRRNYHGIYALQMRLDFKDGGTRLLRSHTFGAKPKTSCRRGSRAPTAGEGCPAR